MRKSLLSLALFAIIAGLTASAQPPVVAPNPRPVGEPTPGDTPDTGPVDPSADKGGKGKAAGPAESSRMASLKQLSFDRRPS